MTNLCQRFNSTAAWPTKGPAAVVPLAVAGITAAVYYYYRASLEKPIAATSKPTLRNPNEWMDFKVGVPNRVTFSISF